MEGACPSDGKVDGRGGSQEVYRSDALWVCPDMHTQSPIFALLTFLGFCLPPTSVSADEHWYQNYQRSYSPNAYQFVRTYLLSIGGKYRR